MENYVLVSDDGTKFKISNDIIKKSALWSRIVNSDFEESKTKQINTNINTNDLDILLFILNVEPFTYDNILKNVEKYSLTDLSRLLEYSDMFLLKDLKNYFEDAIYEKITQIRSKRKIYELIIEEIDIYNYDNMYYIKEYFYFSDYNDLIEYLFTFLKRFIINDIVGNFNENREGFISEYKNKYNINLLNEIREKLFKYFNNEGDDSLDSVVGLIKPYYINLLYDLFKIYNKSYNKKNIIGPSNFTENDYKFIVNEYPFNIKYQNHTTKVYYT